MPTIDQLRQLIVDKIANTQDVELLDLVYKLLLPEG